MARRKVTRLSVASRVMAASLGGYAVCYAWISALVLLVPMDRVDAVILFTCLAFILFVAIILRAFAIASPRRLWIEILVGAALPAAIALGATR